MNLMMPSPVARYIHTPSLVPHSLPPDPESSVHMATYLNAPPAATTMAASYCHAFSGGSLRLLRPSRPTLHVTCQASSSSSQQQPSPSRRSACLGLGLSFACAVLLRPRAVAAATDGGDEEPANNGWWLTEFPLPTPKIVNSKPS